jgi:hypothetical protein
MRRTLTITRTVAVYLLLGFVTTWAVAWGLALREPGTDLQPNHSGHPAVWAGYSFEFGSARKLYWLQHGQPIGTGGTDISKVSLLPPSSAHGDLTRLSRAADLYNSDDWGTQSLRPNDIEPWSNVLDDARGFPFLSFWCSWRSVPVGDTTLTEAWASVDRDKIYGGILLPDHTSLYQYDALRALPYYPIWSGLALNTAFYAFIFFTVVRTTRAFKQSLRHARGLCPRCKYDRQHDYRQPCPECGNAPRIRKTIPQSA